jgi:hypothetical protein
MRFPGRLLSTAAVAAAMTAAVVAAGFAQDATPTPVASHLAGPIYLNGFQAGTCADFDPAPGILLADLQFPEWTAALSGQAGAGGPAVPPDPATFGSAPIPVAQATTELPVSMTDLISSKIALIVHDAENPDRTVACGNLGGVPYERGDLFIGLSETENSGYSGIGWLHDNGSTTTVVVFLANPEAQPAVATGLASLIATAEAEGTPMATPEASADVTPEVDMSATPIA